MKKILCLVLCSICFCSCDRSRFNCKAAFEQIRKSDGIEAPFDKFLCVNVTTDHTSFIITMRPNESNYLVDSFKPKEYDMVTKESVSPTQDEIEVSTSFLDKYFIVDKNNLDYLFPIDSPQMSLSTLPYPTLFTTDLISIRFYDESKENYEEFIYYFKKTYLLLKEYAYVKKDVYCFVDENYFRYSTDLYS